jgi:hypothetical protein
MLGVALWRKRAAVLFATDFVAFLVCIKNPWRRGPNDLLKWALKTIFDKVVENSTK